MAEQLKSSLREVMDLLKLDMQRFLEASMQDPDMRAVSEDYRKGYRQGLTEAFGTTVAVMLKAKGFLG